MDRIAILLAIGASCFAQGERKHTVDVDARDARGRTALIRAMEGSASEYRVIGADEQAVRDLIAKGAAVNARDHEGWTALLCAANNWADQPALFEFLIAKGADVDARLNDGRTALMLAARLGKEGRIRVLIAKGASVSARAADGTTALMIASTIQWDDAAITILKLLVAKGADVNARDNEHHTAADRAALAGYLERAMLLADSGTRFANRANFLTLARNHALLREIEQGDLTRANALLDQGADANFRDSGGRTLLMIASNQEYSSARATLLLAQGADANLADSHGETALMAAADRYNPEIVQLLLEHGADANASDGDGNTVLMHASSSKYNWQEERKPLIHFLLDKNADPHRRNSHGVSALMLMAREGNPAMPLLLDKGVDVNAVDEEGNTALHYAARFLIRGGQRRNAWALLEHGAQVNAANRQGETALILAATQYEPDAARLLLEKGADVNAKTKAGRTALMQAIDGPKEFDNEKHVAYSPQIARILIDAGADVNARDGAGNTALSLARARGYGDIAAVLEKAGAKP